MSVSSHKGVLLNQIVILYYCFMPLIATGILIFRTDGSTFSYIRALNIIFAFIAFISFLYRGSYKLEWYQKYFILFTLITIVLDAIRGQFWSVSKTTIESACLILAAPGFIMTPQLKKNLIKIFIFYIVASFVVLLIQRIFGIYWAETFDIIRFSPEEFYKYRFAGFWYSIDQISGITVLTLLTSIVLYELIKSGKKRWAFIIMFILISMAVLSGSRAFMVYSIVILVGYLFYTSKSVLRRTSRTILIIVLVSGLFFSLGRYGISLENLWNERIYQSEIPFEERSESARTENIKFFFTSDYFTLFGNGFKYDVEYELESGRRHAGLLIGMLNPMFGYGVFSVLYYLFWIALIKKSYSIFRSNRNPFFLAVILGFIIVGFTAGFTYLLHMHAFFLFLFLKASENDSIAAIQVKS